MLGKLSGFDGLGFQFWVISRVGWVGFLLSGIASGLGGSGLEI